jgi:hypothetical protein
MPKGKSSSSRAAAFTPAESRYILDALIKDRKVDAQMIAQYRHKHQEQIASYLDRLRELGVEIGGAAAHVAHVGAEAVSDAAANVKDASATVASKVSRAVKKVKRAISPEREMTQKFQGMYLGLSRAIKDNKARGVFSERYKAAAGQAKQAVIDDMRAYVNGQKGGSAAQKKGAVRRKRR